VKKKDRTKRRSNAYYGKLVTQQMTKLASNYRTQVTDSQLEVFLDALVTWSDYQITTAFDRCLTECLFFPTLADVLHRMPERRSVATGTCPLCEPDGWRLINSPNGTPYRAAVRCDHNPNSYPPVVQIGTPEYDEAIRKLYEHVRYMAEPGLPSRPRPQPRWPHLIGKGVVYKREPGEDS
jgi:hypothetical protein